MSECKKKSKSKKKDLLRNSFSETKHPKETRKKNPKKWTFFYGIFSNNKFLNFEFGRFTRQKHLRINFRVYTYHIILEKKKNWMLFFWGSTFQKKYPQKVLKKRGTFSKLQKSNIQNWIKILIFTPENIISDTLECT